MYQGKYVSKKVRRRKPLALILSLVLVFAVAVGGTIAFLKTSTNSVKNTFLSAKVACSVQETVENREKKSVKIANTGNTDAYIRVAVVANTIDEEGNVTGAADVSAALAGEGWEWIEGYWYWTEDPVAPNGTTGELLKSAIALKGIEVTILADAIQSSPTDAVTEAWGFVPGSSN